MTKCLSIRIYGRVQGVGFRFHTRNKADELNLYGFARNEPDGSVYIEIEGDDESVSEFVDWCRQGPRWATVVSIDVQTIEFKNYTVFSIK